MATTQKAVYTSRVSHRAVLALLGLLVSAGLLALLVLALLTYASSKPASPTLPSATAVTEVPGMVGEQLAECGDPTYKLNGWEHEGYLTDNPVMFPFQNVPNWFVAEFSCESATQGTLEVDKTTGGQFFDKTLETGKAFNVEVGSVPEFPGRFAFRFELAPGMHELVLKIGNKQWPIWFQTRNNVLDWGAVLPSDQAPSTTEQAKQVLLNNARAKYALEKMAGITDTTKCRITQRRNTEPFTMMWMDANLNIGAQEVVPAGKWVWLPVCQVERDGQIVEVTIPINPDCFNLSTLPPRIVPGGPGTTPVVPGRTPRIQITVGTGPTSTPPPVPTEGPPPGFTPVVLVTPSVTPGPPPTSTPMTGLIQIIKRHQNFAGDTAVPETGATLQVADATCGTVSQSKPSGGLYAQFSVNPGTYCAQVVYPKERGEPIPDTNKGQSAFPSGNSFVIRQPVVIGAGQTVPVDFLNRGGVSIQEVPTPTPVPVAPAAPTNTPPAPAPTVTVSGPPATSTSPAVISPTPMPATPTFPFVVATIAPPANTPGPSPTGCCPATPQFSPAPTFVPSVAASYTAIWTPQPTPTRPPVPPTLPPTTPTIVPTVAPPTFTAAPAATAGPQPSRTPFA